MEKASPLKKYFLIDGLGALVSAFLLGVVLVQFEWFFGIPKSALYLLAFLPCLFAVYDFYCYFRVNRTLATFLKGIGILNLLYCCLSIGLAIQHQELITKYGWFYIIIEVLIVAFIGIIELRAAKRSAE